MCTSRCMIDLEATDYLSNRFGTYNVLVYAAQLSEINVYRINKLILPNKLIVHTINLLHSHI